MANDLEPAALKAQIITELLPVLQQFMQNQPVAERVEKTAKDKALEKRAQEREDLQKQSRQKYLAQIEKNKKAGRLENLPPIAAKTVINNTPRPNPANDPAKVVWDGRTQNALNAVATVDLAGIQAQINVLSTRVDSLDTRLTAVETTLAAMNRITLQYVSGNYPSTATFVIDESNP